MLNLPSINPRDTAFTRELKHTIIELNRKLERQRIRGDGATFTVTGSGGGLVGHAKATPPAIAKVTTADPLTVDLYRGEGDNEKIVHTEVTDVGNRAVGTPAVDDRYIAFMARGVWELVARADVLAAIGKITTDNADGTYNAVEQEWDATGAAWQNKTNGITWDGTTGNQQPLLEIDETSGVATDTIVTVVKTTDNTGASLWVFAASTLSAIGTVSLDALTVTTGTVTATVTSADGTALASQSVTIHGAPDGTTFNGSVTALCMLIDGTWTAKVGVWDYHENLTGYNAANVQVLMNNTGSLEWFDTCDPV